MAWMSCMSHCWGLSGSPPGGVGGRRGREPRRRPGASRPRRGAPWPRRSGALPMALSVAAPTIACERRDVRREGRVARAHGGDADGGVLARRPCRRRPRWPLGGGGARALLVEHDVLPGAVRRAVGRGGDASMPHARAWRRLGPSHVQVPPRRCQDARARPTSGRRGPGTHARAWRAETPRPEPADRGAGRRPLRS